MEAGISKKIEDVIHLLNYAQIACIGTNNSKLAKSTIHPSFQKVGFLASG
jgi:hypothetical protein